MSTWCTLKIRVVDAARVEELNILEHHWDHTLEGAKAKLAVELDRREAQCRADLDRIRDCRLALATGSLDLDDTIG